MDAASLAFGIWSKALLEDPSIAQRIPNLPDLVHSTKSGPGPTGFAGGVGCFVRTDRGFDAYGYAQGDGQVRLVTGQEILRIFACEPSTPGLDNREDNDLLLASLVIGYLAPLAKPQLQAVQLKGIRKTVWNKLNDSLHLNADGVEALDALYRHPLTHRAERVLRKSSHSGNLQELADMLVALNRDEELVTKAFGLDPIRIVSSMGITS
ncbi:MAG: hypothetical protein JW384_00593 [Nitrosomonadaceae bacterium]|nr:hypothetical protein [Nitrosomonadaceae bacterium]